MQNYIISYDDMLLEKIAGDLKISKDFREYALKNIIPFLKSNKKKEIGYEISFKKTEHPLLDLSKNTDSVLVKYKFILDPEMSWHRSYMSYSATPLANTGSVSNQEYEIYVGTEEMQNKNIDLKKRTLGTLGILRHEYHHTIQHIFGFYKKQDQELDTAKNMYAIAMSEFYGKSYRFEDLPPEDKRNFKDERMKHSAMQSEAEARVIEMAEVLSGNYIEQYLEDFWIPTDMISNYIMMYDYDDWESELLSMDITIKDIDNFIKVLTNFAIDYIAKLWSEKDPLIISKNIIDFFVKGARPDLLDYFAVDWNKLLTIEFKKAEKKYTKVYATVIEDLRFESNRVSRERKVKEKYDMLKEFVKPFVKK